MYTDINFKSKKALKEAVAKRVAYLEAQKKGDNSVPAARAITVYQPNGDLTGTTVPTNGRVTIEGPHYPEPHRFYAVAILENGEVKKVS